MAAVELNQKKMVLPNDINFAKHNKNINLSLALQRKAASSVYFEKLILETRSYYILLSFLRPMIVIHHKSSYPLFLLRLSYKSRRARIFDETVVYRVPDILSQNTSCVEFTVDI